MAKMSDVFIINWNKTEAKPVASGFDRTIRYWRDSVFLTSIPEYWATRFRGW